MTPVEAEADITKVARWLRSRRHPNKDLSGETEEDDSEKPT